MKRAFALFLLCVLMSVAFAQAEVLRHVVDEAGLFSAEQVADFEARMQGVYEAYGFDSVIFTDRNASMDGKPAFLYAADFYDTFRDYDRYPDGVIFYINPEIREYFQAARGRGMKALGAHMADKLDGVVLPFLRGNDYGGAMDAYLEYMAERVRPKSAFEVAGRFLPWLALAGLVIGLISVTVMKGKLKTAKPQVGASRYMLRDTLALTQAQDIYLYQTVTRTKIESDSKRGGSSGGSSFSSSSGHSYSGSGGKY